MSVDDITPSATSVVDYQNICDLSPPECQETGRQLRNPPIQENQQWQSQHTYQNVNSNRNQRSQTAKIFSEDKQQINCTASQDMVSPHEKGANTIYNQCDDDGLYEMCYMNSLDQATHYLGKDKDLFDSNGVEYATSDLSSNMEPIGSIFC